MFSVVSYGEAQADPYPYVWVNDDGSYRELDAGERQYLEQAFSPFDGGRPYVKSSYSSRTSGGLLRGYLRRSLLPEDARSVDGGERKS